MRIGVISDTHMPFNAAKLPQELSEVLKGCDLIIHAGDLTEISVLSQLKEYAEVKAVSGNMDSAAVRKELPSKLIIDTCGKKIGVVHGEGAPKGLLDKVSHFFDEKLDVVIFGHSHTPLVEEIEGTIFVNPGSPTDHVFSPYLSFAIIEINGADINAEIIKLKG